MRPAESVREEREREKERERDQTGAAAESGNSVFFYHGFYTLN